MAIDNSGALSPNQQINFKVNKEAKVKQRIAKAYGRLSLGALCVAMLAFAVWTEVGAAQVPRGCNGMDEYCDETEICAWLGFISFCSTVYYYYPPRPIQKKVKHV
ncbi:MAG: hypothetical protein OXK74_13210 [Gemmatimonadota bacterium]|nr:hypothetical protein [Gemmatimonadota bacterium]